jgi:DNA-binding CsgD family transcriptional regulator/tetratricopeptide (TPR) repeat protein
MTNVDHRLIGREPELAELVAALDAAKLGHGRMLVLTGEAGIGKSRLAAETVTTARERGFTVAEGRAHSLHAGLAYAPIVEALRPYLSAHTELADLGRLFADPRFPAAVPLGDPELERTRMFEAVARLLERLAREHPVLLFVDDLHWADRGTIELLHYLGRALTDSRTVLLATSRTNDAGVALSDLLTAIRRDLPASELRLSPLTDSSVAELVRDVLGAAPPAEFLHGVTDRAKGIPLFVTALAHGTKLLADELPAIIRDLVLSRLRRLEPPERQLLEFIAVAGESASAEVLRTTGQTTNSALRALLSGGLITEVLAGRSLHYRVAHPMYAEVAYGELSAGERRQLHAVLAEAIDAGTPDDVLSLAPHYREAGDLVDPKRAAEVMEEAGFRALRIHAYEEAIQYLGSAIDEAAEGSERLNQLRNASGQALIGLGRMDDAITAWTDNAASAAEAGRLEEFSSTQFRIALLESERGNLAAAQRHAAKGAIRLPEPADLGTDLIAVRTIFTVRHGDRAALRATVDQLAALEEPSTVPAVRAAAGLRNSLIAVLDSDFAAARDHALEAAEHGRGAEGRAVVVENWALHDVVGYTVLAGELETAVGYAERGLDIQTRSGVAPARCTGQTDLTLTRYLTGDLPSALLQMTASVEYARRARLPRSLARALSCQAFLLAESGQLGEAAKTLAEADAIPTAHEPGLVALAEVARGAIATHTGRPGDVPPLTYWAVHHEPTTMALRLAFAGPEAAALVDVSSPFLDVLVDRATGIHTRDADLLGKTAKRLADFGSPLLAAQTRLAQAELTSDVNAVLDTLAVFERAGAVPWAERARHLARSLGLRLPVPRRSGPLSKREFQVAGLVGEGLSNADIATRLFLSERTVETHLRNTYAKLGLSSRLALARWITDHET